MDTREITLARYARRLFEAKKETAEDRKDIEELKEVIKGLIKPLDCYPVGSIYITVSNISPAQLFGGSWEEYAQGRVLAGYKSDDADFNQAGKTGGTKTVTLTEAQIPKHKHTIRWYQGQYISLSGNGTGESSSGYRTGYSSGTVYNNAMTADLQEQGGGAHQNMQPYITVKIWRRTA
ncbi:MAG: hypothetical protein M0R40_08645 [Firmicutes bacterium]|nr:hypothetical protein [Bacillota bacterium]